MAFVDGENGENFMTEILGLPQFGRSDTWKKQSQTDNKIMENYEKKYKEALERARELQENSNGMILKKWFWGVFPELKEKESEDEQMIERLKSCVYASDITPEGREEILAWLEKQGQVKESHISQHESKTCEENNEFLTNEDERIKETLKGFVKGYSAFINGQWRLGDFTVNRLIDWLEKQGKSNTFKVPETSIKDAEEVTSRMQYIEDDMKPIAEFIINYANWNLHKDEWNQPTLAVPLFRVLDALIQKGKPYGECVQNIEKQGEKKSADKVEPKSHEGEWLCENEPNNYARFIQILEIVNVQGKEIYRISRDIHNDEDIVEIDFVEKYYHKFDIKDAKAGDVLVNGSNIFIFHFLNDTRLMGYCHVNIDDGRFYDDLGKNECFCLIYAVVNPATKNQRDTLFAKMKEAGYEWDAEKKELKKIEPKALDTDKVIEWLKNTIKETVENCGTYRQPYLIQTRLILPYNSIEDLINDFKEDFGL